MQDVAVFLGGMATMGFLLAGLFFFRFWVRTKDSLFAKFGIAFWLLAANQAFINVSGIPREDLSWAYILRILAFAMLIYGIVGKNLSQKSTT
jgi:hypothetical protein